MCFFSARGRWSACPCSLMHRGESKMTTFEWVRRRTEVCLPGEGHSYPPVYLMECIIPTSYYVTVKMDWDGLRQTCGSPNGCEGHQLCLQTERRQQMTDCRYCKVHLLNCEQGLRENSFTICASWCVFLNLIVLIALLSLVFPFPSTSDRLT